MTVSQGFCKRFSAGRNIRAYFFIFLPIIHMYTRHGKQECFIKKEVIDEERKKEKQLPCCKKARA